MKNLKKTPAPAPELSDEEINERQTAPEGQTSIKRGMKSDAQKREASRPEYDASPGAKPKPGAHGDPTHKPARGSDNRLGDEGAPEEEPLDGGAAG
ncbi:MAG: hypothetical protein SFV54_21260 [Bryobacteraceae bacterium]|nr:hypothetical protein [Bryobacteraceae bacterium]